MCYTKHTKVDLKILTSYMFWSIINVTKLWDPYMNGTIENHLENYLSLLSVKFKLGIHLERSKLVLGTMLSQRLSMNL